MLREAELEIEKVSSAIFQPPAEKPLKFQPPRNGYYEKAGFTTLKVKKAFRHSSYKQAC